MRFMSQHLRGQSSNIKNNQGRKGLKAGRRQKKRVKFSDYEEKREAEEKAFSTRHNRGTFRPPVTYSVSLDYIKLPNQNTFNPPEEYYCTAFHELIHATGHISRL